MSEAGRERARMDGRPRLVRGLAHEDRMKIDWDSLERVALLADCRFA